MLNNYKLRLFSLILLAGFSWSGCNIINPVEPVPTYIHIDSFAFESSSRYPVSTHAITQVWAYYNGTAIGAFDLPATIPIIASGSGNLTLDPGIVVDGLNSLLSTYPFYELDTSTLVAQPGKVINYLPHTRIFPSVNDTDIGGLRHDLVFFQVWTGNGNLSSQAAMVPDASITYDGSYVGSITLGNGLDSSILYGTVPFTLSYTDGEQKYIEIDYKCDIPFQLGLQTSVAGIASSPYFLAGIYPSSTWQKFYLAVADFAGQYQGDSYNLFIRTTLPPDSTSGHVYITNIQLLRFFP